MALKSPIDIVLSVWNRPAMTERVIRDLAVQTTTPSRLIVVDDGSEKETYNMLQKFKRDGIIDTLIRHKKNIGLEASKNDGMQAVQSELFVSTDNDCLPEYYTEEGDWLSKLVKLMDERPDFGAIACRTQVMIGTGNIYDGFEEQPVVDFPWPGGSLRIMRSQLVRDLGGWRDWEPSRGSEEKHICQKIREAGYRTGFAVKVRTYHMFGEDGNWGYGGLEPELHGHTPVCHPAIQNGDNEDDIGRWLSHEV
jgi:glycosyltransferase involved in cell wall biosynthesis